MQTSFGTALAIKEALEQTEQAKENLGVAFDVHAANAAIGGRPTSKLGKQQKAKRAQKGKEQYVRRLPTGLLLAVGRYRGLQSAPTC